MPSEGTVLSPASHLLSDDEIIRLATIFVQHGVNKIRLTGGEPTVRKSIVELVGELHLVRNFAENLKCNCLRIVSSFERSSPSRASFYCHDKQWDSFTPKIVHAYKQWIDTSQFEVRVLFLV
jgi:organic radical activating enzyme